MVEVPRYFVFFGSHYYPDGGAKDEHERFDNLEAAKRRARELVAQRNEERTYLIYEWAHIYDIAEGRLLVEFESYEGGPSGDVNVREYAVE